MLRRLAVASVLVSLAACHSASSQPPAWRLTRDGVEVHHGGSVTRVPLPGWTWAGPPYGKALALSAGPAGEVLVTSDVVPTVWRIEPRTLRVSLHPLALDADRDKDVGFVGLAYSVESAAYFARATHDRSCWRIDAALARAHRLRPGENLPLAAAAMCGQQ